MQRLRYDAIRMRERERKRETAWEKFADVWSEFLLSFPACNFGEVNAQGMGAGKKRGADKDTHTDRQTDRHTDIGRVEPLPICEARTKLVKAQSTPLTLHDIIITGCI